MPPNKRRKIQQGDANDTAESNTYIKNLIPVPE